ncbi:MAG TPA: hypothetical protein VK400_13595 [Pyrinomonadaceae bacterium]|nr:hypothetical protein [Pyrinomonadaceae bacterium]
MKKIILGINLILLLAAFAAAQTQKNGDVLIQSGTNLEAQLESALDVKKSKPGDEVVLRTTKAIRQNGQVVVPKGTRLIGRVTDVQQKTRQNAASRLDVVFERIQGKNLDAPLRATILSITQASANANVGDTSGSDISGSTSSTGNVSSGSGSGGGLLGGVGSTVGGVVNSTTQTVGGVTNTAGQTVSGATRTLGRTINGIRISNSTDASASGSTTLSTNNNNLRLEKGVMFQLRLSEAVQN